MFHLTREVVVTHTRVFVDHFFLLKKALDFIRNYVNNVK